MDPVARQAHDDVSGPNRAAVHDLRLPHDPEVGTRKVEFPDDLGNNGDLPADDRDVRHLRSAVQPDADLTGYLAVVRLDRDVVDEGDRLRAHADHVVYDHPDPVHAHPVPTAHLPAGQDLPPPAIPAQGER